MELCKIEISSYNKIASLKNIIEDSLFYQKVIVISDKMKMCNLQKEA